MSEARSWWRRLNQGFFKGSPTITIHELDDEGRRKQYPLISFGKKKALAILKHLDEIKEFVK